MHLWPPIVETALAAGNTDLAEDLLKPVTTAPSGIVSPAVNAQYHRLNGLIMSLRDADTTAAERELRIGIQQFETYGAPGLAARAKVELARLLARQAGDTQTLLAEARDAFHRMGADGWLAQME
jgi:hypothetical protein